MLNIIFLYRNSEATSISIEMFVSSSNQYFAMRHEWCAVPQPIKIIFSISWGLIGKLYKFISFLNWSTYSLIQALAVIFCSLISLDIKSLKSPFSATCLSSESVRTCLFTFLFFEL